jgi:hypothetical protein
MLSNHAGLRPRDDYVMGRNFGLVVCARNRCTNKTAPFASWLGANRSDTEWYREDSQRRHGAKGAALCAAISGADH